MALGIHFDLTGGVRYCASHSVQGIPAASTLGRVRTDASGLPLLEDFKTLLAAREMNMGWGPCIASQPVNYRSIAWLREIADARWISSTVAMGIEYAFTELGPEANTVFFAMHQECGFVSVSAFEWGGSMLEVLDCAASGFGAKSGIADTIARLLEAVGFGWDRLFERAVDYPLIFKSDREDFAQLFSEACKLLKRRGRNGAQLKASLSLWARENGCIARGAALQSKVLCGDLKDFLLVDMTLFDAYLVFGEHRMRVYDGQESIPDRREAHINSGAGEQFFLELNTFGTIGPAERYHLPVDARKLDEAVRSGNGFDVYIDADPNDIYVEFAANGWSQKFSLNELACLTIEQGAPNPGAEPNRTAYLMDLIATLDDIDFAVRALDENGQLDNSAGEAIIVVQQRLLRAIAKFGGEYYSSIGETFDPFKHEAFSVVAVPELPANFVVDELRRGFMYDGRVLRYSLVQVANPR